ncbi:Cytochrome c-551 precursor [Roseovarius gaetbuli]|uniref:Cytochrome c-551 n=1 Tax=Roseovarius gaetbuli TaxID=1356575 RepID=A0A1X6Z1Z5_9RHOB|nr:cytochrome c [Roseovarius gaetbuli]SLN37590.1 Cytochrome c-551 precursor [Roseovarius gaetbuli]
MNRLTLILALAATPALADPDPKALKRLVRQDCGSCHGMTLKGGLGPDIRPASLAHYRRDDLTDVILDGLPGTPMPPWRPLLSKDEAAWIADYLLEGDPE